MDLYSQYLLVSPQNRGCTKLADAMETMSHDSVLNFLIREAYEPSDLFARLRGILHLEGGTLSVDDSIWDKPYSQSSCNELIARHYSGKHHRTVQGICIVSLFYTDVNGLRMPVNYRIYVPANEKTKNEIFREMLDEVLAWGLKPQLVSGDTWYASGENLRWIRRHQLDAFFAVEIDRLISRQKGVYEAVGKVDVPDEGLFTHLKKFDFVTLFREEQSGKFRHYIYYKYVKAEQAPQKVERKDFEKAHQEHWHIEEFHRAIKQLCNAENFLVRRTKAVKNHIFAVFWAFVSLEDKVKQKIISNWYQFREQIQKHFIKNNLT